MRLTLLEYVQEILSDMDSDEVTSISDTAESMQVARIVRKAYFNIQSRANLPEHNNTFQLIETTSATPTLMTKPASSAGQVEVARLDWVKYDKKDTVTSSAAFDYVTILPYKEFMDIIQQLDTDQTNVGSYTYGDGDYNYRNDKHPSYCTVYLDYNVIFDSYDSTVDTPGYLQTTNTFCFGLEVPVFTLSDGFYPTIGESQVPLLLNEAKSIAFMDLKQLVNPKAEKEARRGWVSLGKTKWLNEPLEFDQLPNFGRK